MNPVIPAELTVDHSVVTDVFGRRMQWPSMSRTSTSATTSATASSSGVRSSSTSCPWCRPGPGSCTKSISSIWPTWSSAGRPGVPRHPGRYRLAHNDDQRAGSAGLGWAGSRRRRRCSACRSRPDPAGGRPGADRRTAAGRHGDRSGADDRGDVARHGVVGTSWSSPARRSERFPRRSGDVGEYEPGVRSTCAIFPIDQITLDYLRFTGRDAELVDTVERYAKEQGLWHDPQATLRYTDLIRLDLSTVEPSLAGPRRPQDRIPLASARSRFQGVLAEMLAERSLAESGDEVDEASQESFPASDAPAISCPATPRRRPSAIEHGAVAIAAITSCTNTSNPSVMVAAGLLARNAVAAGLATKPWVKTSLAPGSKVVTDYLNRSGLDRPLEQLGFHTVGYGCMTCIGNSGPLTPQLSKEIAERGVLVAAVLSGNRNFDGRINNEVSLNYLASPPWWWPTPSPGRWTWT